MARFAPRLTVIEDRHGVPGAFPEAPGLALVGDGVAGDGWLLDRVLATAAAAAERLVAAAKEA